MDAPFYVIGSDRFLFYLCGRDPVIVEFIASENIFRSYHVGIIGLNVLFRPVSTRQ